MQRKLSFSFVSAPTQAEFADFRYLAVEVFPYVDGVPLYSSAARDIFDAVDLLVLGAQTAETDIFTCSCGVAGCAGIHWPCQVAADATSVSWTFPEEPFRNRLNPAVFTIGSPLALTFARAHYEAALAQLERDLEQLRLTHALPLVVTPCSEPDGPEQVETFPEFLQTCRERHADHQAWQTAVLEAEGALRDSIVVAELPGGARLSCNVADIAWELMDHIERPEDKLAHLHDSLRRIVLADPLGAVEALAATQLEDLFYLEDDSPVRDVPKGWSFFSAVVQWSVQAVANPSA